MRGESPNFYYWRSSAGLEVDFMIERNGKLYAIEIKATSTPKPAHAERLAEWLALSGKKARGVIACNIAEPQPLLPPIRAVPWHLAW